MIHKEEVIECLWIDQPITTDYAKYVTYIGEGDSELRTFMQKNNKQNI